MIVAQIEDIAAVQRFPMSHQAPVLYVVVANIHQIERIAHGLVQVQEINGQAIVERVACRMDDFRRWKQRLDQADQQKVIGSLVRDESGVTEEIVEHVDVLHGDRFEQ